MAFIEGEFQKSKQTSNISVGKVYITAGFNNTIVTVADAFGKTVCVGSAGSSGFRGTRKATPFAATVATEAIAKKAYQKGLREVSVFVKGPGNGRISAIKALKNAGLIVISIADVTPIPHNGCRQKNRRRV